MNDTELATLLKHIDAALEVYRNHRGALRAPEISVKSMLVVLREKIVGQLSTERATER